MAKSVEKILRSYSNEQTPEVISEGRDLSFGQFLRRERVLRGITKNEIIRVTKVSPDYYEALESNDFGKLPEPAVVVGFLRVLSKYAGLDGDETVNRFLAETRGEKKILDEVDASFLRRNYKRLLVACGFACLLVLMFMPHFFIRM